MDVESSRSEGRRATEVDQLDASRLGAHGDGRLAATGRTKNKNEKEKTEGNSERARDKPKKK